MPLVQPPEYFPVTAYHPLSNLLSYSTMLIPRKSPHRETSPQDTIATLASELALPPKRNSIRIIKFRQLESPPREEGREKSGQSDECDESGDGEEVMEDVTLCGLLTLEQADQSDTLPQAKDKWLFSVALEEGLMTPSPVKQPLQRRGRGRPPKNPLSHSSGVPTPEIRQIHFGLHSILAPWHSSPFPAEYFCQGGELHICEWCLKYMRPSSTMHRHVIKCRAKLPPGDEIYRDERTGISVFEVDGRKSKLYCQNLCLLAKMFLDHKTLYYDVDTFLFYVLIEWRRIGENPGHFTYSFVGYFSKEKHSPSDYNVSCIVTLPNHQRKGYGAFLIDFSYLLSRKENKRGTPEKPLSDLGLLGYSSYWKDRVVEQIDIQLGKSRNPHESVNIDSICSSTGMTVNDVLATLEYLRLLKRCPNTGLLEMDLESPNFVDYRAKLKTKRSGLRANPEWVLWSPYTCLR